MREGMETGAILKMRHRRVAALIGLVAVALGSARPAAAGRNVWTPIGPDGADVSALAVDPTNPRIAYAATDRSVYKTVDGEHWRRTAGRRLRRGPRR
jgi:hypothetical protein